MNAQVITLPASAVATITYKKKNVVDIGSKFDGKPAGFADTRTGTYWEILPQIEGDNLKLQQCLMGWKTDAIFAAHMRALNMVKKSRAD